MTALLIAVLFLQLGLAVLLWVVVPGAPTLDDRRRRARPYQGERVVRGDVRLTYSVFIEDLEIAAGSILFLCGWPLHVSGTLRLLARARVVA